MYIYSYAVISCCTTFICFPISECNQSVRLWQVSRSVLRSLNIIIELRVVRSLVALACAPAADKEWYHWLGDNGDNRRPAKFETVIVSEPSEELENLPLSTTTTTHRRLHNVVRVPCGCRQDADFRHVHRHGQVRIILVLAMDEGGKESGGVGGPFWRRWKLASPSPEDVVEWRNDFGECRVIQVGVWQRELKTAVYFVCVYISTVGFLLLIYEWVGAAILGCTAERLLGI